MIERHREKFLDWVIIKWHWEQKFSFHQRALSECFALLNFNLKLILILLNLYWCQNQRFPFLESTTGSRNSLAIHEMDCIGENTFLMKRQKGVMCYKINRLIANLNTGTTWEAFMPVLDWARQLSVPIRPLVLQQCIRVMIFTTFLMLMLSSILRPI